MEMIEHVRGKGFASLQPGDIGENITTSGIDLLALPTDTVLHIGKSAVVKLTGLRNPCPQIDKFERGLMAAFLDHDAETGQVVRKAGVMSVVLESGDVLPGDEIVVVLPPLPHRAMDKV